MRFNSRIPTSSLAIAVLFLTGAVASAQDTNFTNCTNPSNVWATSNKGCASSPGTTNSEKLPASAQVFDLWVDANSGATVTAGSIVAGPSGTGLTPSVGNDSWKWDPSVGVGIPLGSIEMTGNGTDVIGTVLVSDSGSWFQLTSLEIGQQQGSSIAAKTTGVTNARHPEYDVTYTILFCAGVNGCTSANDLGSWTGSLGRSSGSAPAFTPVDWVSGDYSGSAKSIEIMIDTPGGGNAYLDDIDIHVPEGAGLSMLALCGLGLAGAFLFKARRGLFMNR
jgi:hypothetical protein